MAAASVSPAEMRCPTAPGAALGSVGGPDPGSFHVTASAPGPGGGEILCVPFESGVSPPCSLKVSSPSLLSQTLWGLVLPMQGPQAGEPGVGSALAPVGDAAHCDSAPVCGLPPGVWVWAASRLCPSYVSPRGSFFMSLVEDFFLVGSSLLH